MAKAKVRMLTAMGGEGINYQAGDVIELEPDVAKRFVEHQCAEPAPASALARFRHSESGPAVELRPAAVRGGSPNGGPSTGEPASSAPEGEDTADAEADPEGTAKKGKGKGKAGKGDDAGK